MAGRGPAIVAAIVATACTLLGGCAQVGVNGGKDAGSDAPSGNDTGLSVDRPAIPVDSSIPPPPDAGGGGTDAPACTPVSCTQPSGQYCGMIGDGCGKPKDCGTCAGAGQMCAADHVCVEGPTCVRGTCNGAGGAKYCGRVGTGCGEAIECAACAAGSTCSTDGVCVPANCTPAGCDIPGGGGKYCGKIGDGCGKTIDCTCAAPQTCGGTGLANVCGDPNCVPLTCNPTRGGQYCGTIGNGCGKALECPATCPSNVACPASHACPGSGGCTGLQCQIAKDNCPTASPTTLTGVVYDPAARNPLYNILVYVPNTTLSPIPSGASCDRCGAEISGQPIAAALTDAQGRFTMKNVPSGANIPLVIQVGKWRRQVTVPTVAACVSTALTDKNLTRLPRNQSEGSLPKIAIATGHSDAAECLLRKVGVSDSEFTSDTGSGRVHLFQGFDASPTITIAGASTPLKSADTLWSTTASLMRYDVVLMACEGSSEEAEGRTAAEYTAVRGYADMGGKIFGSHYHTKWIHSEDGEADAGYPQIVKFASGEGPLPDQFPTNVDVSFPKGIAFRDWLGAVGASATPGVLLVDGSKHLVDNVIPGMAQAWLTGYDTSKKTNTLQYFSFTAPVGQTACGRMVFSDIHVSQGGGDFGTLPFPTRCEMISQDMKAQEKALEFMLFDISSCVQIETGMPQPPPIPPPGSTPPPPGTTPTPPAPPPPPPPPPPPKID